MRRRQHRRAPAAFGGAYIANEGFTRESAEAAIAAGRATRGVGVQYIANPDLARRFALKAPLNRPNPPRSTRRDRGYTDYPALA